VSVGRDSLATARLAVLVLRDMVARMQDLRADTAVELDRACAEARERWEQGLGPLLAAHGEALASVRPVGAPGWVGEAWSSWSPPGAVLPVHLGWLRTVPDERLVDLGPAADARFSVTADVRALGGLLVRCGHPARGRALRATRALITRLLAGIPPGKARFTFFDPQGLGQAVAPFLRLADYDPKLVDGKVWSRADDLRARLGDLTGHIELVIQKYLRGEYDDIDTYNAHAGEIAEPYRILVVFDFPGQFDEDSFADLVRIVEIGPRCGVLTLVIANHDLAEPNGVSLGHLAELMPTVDVDGHVALRQHGGNEGAATLAIDLDDDPLVALGEERGQALVDRIVDGVGQGRRGAGDAVVSFDRMMDLFSDTARSGRRPDIPRLVGPVRASDPATWWTASSAHALCAPFGQSGARDVAALGFDSEIHSGALLVGRPGAGKSTLLHSYVCGLCTLYDPDELELYLVDFKEGVEFKGYAEAGLPHARCVAVESEREFGLSVLESIVAEMRRRAELIRATGGQQTTFARLREAVAERLPRMLLVFDEFHVLFADDDRLGALAADHMETIVRQGRGFGVHVLLGSQSLSGLDALGRHVLQLLPIRILLPSSEGDAAVVLGERNDAWKLLSRRGEGVFNAAGGAVEANAPFQAAFQTEDERLDRLRRFRGQADARGYPRRPVVFEGYAAARLDDLYPADAVAAVRTGEPGLALRVGAPLTLSGPVVVRLRREAGANALVVAKPTGDVPMALLVSAVGAALATQPNVAVHVVDFTAVDEGVEVALAPMMELDGVTLVRRRQAEATLNALAATVSQRVSDDDVHSTPVLLVLYGLHRARDLDPARAEAYFAEDVTEPDLLAPLKQILVDGPEFGVHTLAWIDSIGGMARRLPSGLQREFGVRIAGTLSREDSIDLIDTDDAAACRAHQVVVLDDATGVVQRATTYAMPGREWLAAYVDALKEVPA
jgi:DNA segregation ATPase FtsK/SpoIIIE, S-DNA-T family